MCKFKLLSFLFFVSFVSSCSFNSNSTDDSEDYIGIVRTLVGKNLIIPGTYVYQIGHDTIDLTFENTDFKIINYIDSAECNQCYMQLQKWNEAIGKFKALQDVDVTVMTILNTTADADILRVLEVNDFKYPIVFDKDGLFKQCNLPQFNKKCHVFLLDSDDKILAIGNPAINVKVMNLYHRILTGQADTNEYDKSDIMLCPDGLKSIGLAQVGDSVNVSFDMYNATAHDIVIDNVIPSCGCIKILSYNTIIKSNEEGVLNVEIIPTIDNKGEYIQYIEVYYKGFEKPEILNVYGYVQI
ncbi:MAG: DUF1573 domain-containing protein [Prevotella sp.]|nr:DUF1573 domain-containing protein [Prevotella sp.]